MIDDYKNYIEDDYKYKNDKIIKNIYNEEIIIEKEIIYNKYLEVTDFSKLFSRRLGVSSPTQPTIPRTQVQPQVPPVQQPSPVAPTPPAQVVQPSAQGKTYNASQMWSPVSSAGIIYEWNRGVIVISQDGTTMKEKLDGTYNHHADATVRCLSSLGIITQDTNAPFQAGIDGASSGAIVFQSEGDNGLVYFPSVISEEQLNELTGIIAPRSSFNFSYTYGDEIFEDQDFRSVLLYAANLQNMAQVRR